MMNKETVQERLRELEALIIDTEELIRKGKVEAELMIEPIKSHFLIHLGMQEVQLNTNKFMVENLKRMVKD